MHGAEVDQHGHLLYFLQGCELSPTIQGSNTQMAQNILFETKSNLEILEQWTSTILALYSKYYKCLKMLWNKQVP